MATRLVFCTFISLALAACDYRGSSVQTGTARHALDKHNDGGVPDNDGGPLPEALPDLTVVQSKLQESLQIIHKNFPEDACEIKEQCIGGPGRRKLVKFTTSVPNIGTADFFIGDPSQHPDAHWDDCHGHYHYHEYASYRLLDTQGNVAASGHKQAFCVKDTDQVDPEAGEGKYTCSNQGVTIGWADTYRSHLPCQWVDITGVPPGDYVVEVTVNPTRHIVEHDYNNNIATATLTIPAE
jgi:hypothetical protein